MTIGNGVAANGAGHSALVIEGTTASFQKDVIDASREQPVIVDFWAPWCGPCRTLGPAIERVVNDNNGKVKLVKINVDENQEIAGQFRVQSIPTVYAFAGGQPVDGFMGALPESEIRRFVEHILKNAPATDGANGGDEIARALSAAAEAVNAGDLATAEQIYSAVLEQQPAHADALLGLAGLHEKNGQIDQIKAVLSVVPEEARKRDDYLALEKVVALNAEAAGVGSIEELERRVAADEDDHQARYDLAIALNARGFRVEAAEALVALMRRDRAWKDDAARKKLLEFLDVWGPKDPASLKGRRLLSTALFS